MFGFNQKRRDGSLNITLDASEVHMIRAELRKRRDFERELQRIYDTGIRDRGGNVSDDVGKALYDARMKAGHDMIMFGMLASRFE